MSPKQREIARQRFIREACRSSTMSGAEADSVFHDLFLPLLLSVGDMLVRIEPSNETPIKIGKEIFRKWTGVE